MPLTVNPEITIGALTNGGNVGGITILSVDTYNSNSKDIAIWNMGASGSDTAFWLGDTPSAPMNVVITLDPDLTFINLGLNDLSQRVPVETYAANMRAIVRKARLTGDVVLVIPNRIDPSVTLIDLQLAYEAALFRIASEFGLAVVSLPVALGEFNVASSSGYYFDGVHLTSAGYRREASEVRDLLLL